MPRRAKVSGTPFDTGSGAAGALNAITSLPNVLPGPAYSEGVLFTLCNAPGSAANSLGPWRIAALDPVSGQNIFGNNTIVAPTTGQGVELPGLPAPLGPIAVGYVQDGVTGALDKMIYVPVNSFGGNSGTIYADTVSGIWFGTRDEPLKPSIAATAGVSPQYTPQNARKNVPWNLNAASVNGIDILPHLHIVHKINGAVTGYETLGYPGGFGVTFASHVTTVTITGTTMNPDDEVYADYTLNWSGADLPGANNQAAKMNQGDMLQIAKRFYALAAPRINNNPTNAQLTGGVALSGQDLAVFNSVYTGGANGRIARIYGLHEQFDSGNQYRRRHGADRRQFAAEDSHRNADRLDVLAGAVRELGERARRRAFSIGTRSIPVRWPRFP